MDIPHRASHLLGLSLLVGLLAGALHLHFEGVTQQLLSDDETHSIRVAATTPFYEIPVSYSGADNSIPLTLYAKCLMATVGLSEFSLRVPIMAFDALLLLCPLLFARRLGGATALTAIALLATSPLVVYYAITARPYSAAAVMVLLALSAWRHWLATRSRAALVGFAVASSLAVFFHLYCLFPVATLVALAALEVRSGALSLREWRQGVLLLAALGAILLGPGLPGLIEHRLDKIGQGPPLVDSLLTGYRHLLGHLGPALWIAPVLLVVGTWRCSRRDPRLARAAVCLLAAQALALVVTRPQGNPGVSARYFYMVWPVAIVLFAAGVEGLVHLLLRCAAPRLLDWKGGRGAAAGVLAVGLLLAASVPHFSPIALFTFRDSCFRTGKIMFQEIKLERTTPVLERLRANLASGETLVILPPTVAGGSGARIAGWSRSEAWKRYLALSERSVRVKMVITNKSRHPWLGHPGVRCKNVVDLASGDELKSSGARYLLATTEARKSARRSLVRRYGPPLISLAGEEVFDISGREPAVE